jgi:hypothetical protein
MTTITHQHDGLERIAGGIAAIVIAARAAGRALRLGAASVLRSWEAAQQARADQRTLHLIADLARHDPGMLADYRAAVTRAQWDRR